MNEDIKDTRNYGSAPFKPGDIDVDVLRRTLRAKRKLDTLLLSFIRLSDAGVTSITEDEAVRAFNQLIDSDFYTKVDGDFLRLRPEIRQLLTLAHHAREQGQPVAKEILQTLNRALIHAVYAEETVKSRQFERFAVPEMLRMTVTVSPLSSAFEKTYEGKLLNISAGGMALLLPEKLPELTCWALRISLMDHSEIETLVQIRHSVPQQNQFAHGLQFVSIPSYLGEQVENLAKDFASCESRIKSGAPNVCRETCSLFDHCEKPQKLRKAA